MAVVHAVAEDPKHVSEAIDALDDPGASAEALRHVLVGGTPSVQAFASEVAESEGGDTLPAHKATKIISEVLAEIDSETSARLVQQRRSSSSSMSSPPTARVPYGPRRNVKPPLSAFGRRPERNRRAIMPRSYSLAAPRTWRISLLDGCGLIPQARGLA